MTIWTRSWISAADAAGSSGHFQFIKHAKLYGTDYNRKLIDWCRNHIAFAEFDVNELAPPLRYDDAQFDLTYAYSVFTHLPEPLQFAWIAELSRILKPAGYLLISTHGACFAEKHLPAREKQQFDRGRVVVLREELAGQNDCTTFQPFRFVTENLAKAFKVAKFIPGKTGEVITQDTYLLRKQ